MIDTIGELHNHKQKNMELHMNIEPLIQENIQNT